jgi:electron transfer flavoprotein alpha subunit
MFKRSVGNVLKKIKYSKNVKSLVLIENGGDGKISSSSLCTITAAKQLGGEITALVTGSEKEIETLGKNASKVEGISKVVLFGNEKHSTGELVSNVILNIQKSENFTHILTNHSAFGKNILPRLGANLDVQPISDVMKIISPSEFVRPIYAGNAICEVESTDSVKVMTIRTTCFEKTKEEGSETASVSSVKEEEGKVEKSKWVESMLTKSERPELTSASIIIGGGRGVGSEENFKILYSLADKFKGKAAVGASRAAVDSGMAPNDLQIGQTGKTVAPDLYIAVGISGAIQHIAGMKDSKCIVAINKDKEAPIFQISDYGLVEDLFKAVPEFEKLIQ